MHITRLLRAANGRATKNLTGFDMRALREATAPPRYDPWEQTEAWRYSGKYARWNRFRNSFPGLGIATVAFSAYCAYEHFFPPDDHHQHHDHAAAGHEGAEH